MPIYGSIVILDSGGGSAYTLTANSCLFGSSSKCDVRIQNTYVAPEHCMIQVQEDGKIVLRNLTKQLDLPVKVNNYDVQDIAVVQDNDVFEIGDIKFCWEMPKHLEGVTSPDFSNGPPTITTTLQPSAILVKPVFGSIPENDSRHVKALQGFSKSASNTEIPSSQQPAELQENTDQEINYTNIEPVDNEVISTGPLKTPPEILSSPKLYESLATLLPKNSGNPTSETALHPQTHTSTSSRDTLTATSSAASAPTSKDISAIAPALEGETSMKPETWTSVLPNILKEENGVHTTVRNESPQVSTESASLSKQSSNVAIVSKKANKPRKRHAPTRSRKSVSGRKGPVQRQSNSTSTVKPRVTRRSVTTRKSSGSNKGIVSTSTRSLSPSSSPLASGSMSGTVNRPTHSAASEKVSKAKRRGQPRAVKSLSSRAQPKVTNKTNKRRDQPPNPNQNHQDFNQGGAKIPHTLFLRQGQMLLRCSVNSNGPSRLPMNKFNMVKPFSKNFPDVLSIYLKQE